MLDVDYSIKLKEAELSELRSLVHDAYKVEQDEDTKDLLYTLELKLEEVE